MKKNEYNWANFAEYCYKCGKDVVWNFDGWLGEHFFKEGKKWRERFYTVKEFVRESNPKKVILDLMCGGAYPSRNLAKESNSFFICIDINPQYLQFAKSKAKKEKVEEKVDFIRADATHLPLKDKSVDLTFSIGGFEYLPDIKKALMEAKRVTKEYLILTFTTENFKKEIYYKTRLYHLRYLLGGISYHKIYSIAELKKIFSSVNLNLLENRIVGNHQLVAKLTIS